MVSRTAPSFNPQTHTAGPTSGLLTSQAILVFRALEFLPSFFRDVIGVESTSRSWNFRGSDPAGYYGEGYTIYDFIRLNLYRDIRVYEEVGRRGKLVCNDFNATVGGNTVSVNQWLDIQTSIGERRRLASFEKGTPLSGADR
jgi:hypothetical protein